MSGQVTSGPPNFKKRRPSARLIMSQAIGTTAQREDVKTVFKRKLPLIEYAQNVF